MATVQQSIEISVPVHTLYNQLAQFEDYPRFMEEVEQVRQLDDTHLHWTTIMSNRPVEWDAEITEQEPDRCIAWHNVSGPTNAGKVELQPVGADASRIVFTLESQPEQVPGSMAGYSEEEMARQLKLDLARLKDFIEARGQEPAQGSARAQTPSYAAGSEGFTGDEEPTAPVASSAQAAAEQRNDSAGSSVASASQPQQSSSSPQATETAAPPAMRHVGQMPQDTSAEHHGGTPTSDAMGNPMQREWQGDESRNQPAGAVAGTAAVVGAAGGTDASAGARMAGGPAAKDDGSGAPDGAAIAAAIEPTPAAAGGGGPVAGATAAGGTCLGGADIGADAGTTRTVPREGVTSTSDAAGGAAPQGGAGSANKKPSGGSK